MFNHPLSLHRCMEDFSKMGLFSKYPKELKFEGEHKLKVIDEISRDEHRVRFIRSYVSFFFIPLLPSPVDQYVYICIFLVLNILRQYTVNLGHPLLLPLPLSFSPFTPPPYPLPPPPSPPSSRTDHIQLISMPNVCPRAEDEASGKGGYNGSPSTCALSSQSCLTSNCSQNKYPTCFDPEISSILCLIKGWFEF